MFDEIYKGKNVLVIGHTGFKGSWLSIWLHKLGAKVFGYALNPLTEKDNFSVTKIQDNITDIRGDIRDLHSLYRVFEMVEPEIVFHLAAQPLVRYSYEHPISTYETNVLGTLHVLECIRLCESVKVGIIITTDKCYENTNKIWGYRECDPMGGYDPYSSSKGCAEILTSSYSRSYFNPINDSIRKKSISTVRAGNVIGGGDWSVDRIIQDCIRALQENKTIIVRNPSAIRPWQHVLEPLGGYLLLASKMFLDSESYNGAWNFGPDFSSIATVESVINEVINCWGNGRWSLSKQVHQPHEADLLSLDCTKAKTYLGWKPKLSLHEAIHYTVEWYKSSSDKYNLCMDQISQYENTN